MYYVVLKKYTYLKITLKQAFSAPQTRGWPNPGLRSSQSNIHKMALQQNGYAYKMALQQNGVATFPKWLCIFLQQNGYATTPRL